jgi:hypothetical protein
VPFRASRLTAPAHVRRMGVPLVPASVRIEAGGHWPATAAPSRDDLLFGITAVVSAAVVTLGSGAGLVASRAPNARHATSLVLVHAAVFASWVVLYAVQVILVGTGRTAIHRRLGVAGAALALGMLALGYAVAIQAARTGFAPIPGSDPLGFLVVPLADLVVFASCVGAALFWRRVPAVHKRLMWFATAMLTFASVTRLPLVRGNTPAILIVFFVILLIVPVGEQILTGRMHRLSAWGSALMFLQLPVRRAIGISVWWHAFASWLIR